MHIEVKSRFLCSSLEKVTFRFGIIGTVLIESIFSFDTNQVWTTWIETTDDPDENSSVGDDKFQADLLIGELTFNDSGLNLPIKALSSWFH